VIYGKATLVKIDGSSVQLQRNQDAHLDFEKEWPKGLRNKILLQTLTGSGNPGKTATKHAELHLRLAYMRRIQVEKTNWYKQTDVAANRE
jgi:hypothetical protein